MNAVTDAGLTRLNQPAYVRHPALLAWVAFAPLRLALPEPADVANG